MTDTLSAAIELPRTSVDPSPFVPARYGLLSAAALIDTADPHDMLGLITQPDRCAEAATQGGACSVEPGSKTVGGVEPIAAFDPFTVYAGVNCGPTGRADDAINAMARRALTNGEARAVERVFWTGLTTDAAEIHPHLAEDTADPTGLWPAAVNLGNVASVKAGFGLLEESLGECYGGQGVIHAPRRVTPYLNAGMVTRQGAGLESIVGTRVALYSMKSTDAFGPAQAVVAAGDVWLYATGAVTVRRNAAIDVSQSRADRINRSTNDEQAIAERTYIVGWDCCLFAVRVTLEA